ncbi:DUF3857 domain-containing protein [Flammeovirga pectinis]|uniref:DUF3857 domain-containing protein n=1 Tax=Flammeovirga pectinis TaxID=2494373 RepID=A0A3Q9FLS2_9BACT|nr:DUF3857 domain-containing protein [Flammeovirga pectinis]AZQ60737.1 DUF3857 domain-containing protein [Flammeovirga pectinis]
MMTKQLIIVLMLLMIGQLNAQSLDSIDPNLIKGANSVILSSTRDFKVLDEGSAELHFTKKIVILNKEGKDEAQMVVFYDNSSSISDFKGSIYQNGFKKPKKFKTTEIIDRSTESSGSVSVTDGRVQYIDPTLTTYPVIIEYSYTKKYSGLFSYPTWYPVSDFKQFVLSSSYTLDIPKGFKFRQKIKGIEDPIVSEKEGREIYNWSVNNLPIIKSEAMHLPVYEIFPSVEVQPYGFEYEKTKGRLDTWTTFGDYIYSLNKGTWDLSDETKLEIKELTKSASSDLEKAQIVYNYLQNKVRYISVQLGIGGLKPANSLQVDTKGYGDCKGLSNYMYTLLKEVGVESRYAIIYGGRNPSKVDVEMVGTQFNHAILCLPTVADTVWLECTSQTTPFGYLGKFTGNRKALLIEDGHSKLVNTTSYRVDDNLQTRKSVVKINNNGGALVEGDLVGRGYQFGNFSHWEQLPDKELRERFLRSYALTTSELVNLSIDIDKSYPDPSATLAYVVEVKDFGKNISEGKLIPLFPYYGDYSLPKKYRSRKLAFSLKYDYKDVDEIEFHLPEGTSIEELPTSKEILSDFGSYRSSFTKVSTSIYLYKREFITTKGEFEASRYKDYYAFRTKIKKADKERFWLKNASQSTTKDVE